jgi:hypothetical protein
MPRNESLLIAASYFWSDALNSFLFGHGQMTPTLVDVLLLTSLDVSSRILFSVAGMTNFHINRRPKMLAAGLVTLLSI